MPLLRITVPLAELAEMEPLLERAVDDDLLTEDEAVQIGTDFLLDGMEVETE